MGLDRSKVMRELQHISVKLFKDISAEFDTARNIWLSIAKNESFRSAVAVANFQVPLPLWQGELDQVIPIELNRVKRKTIVAVDGSQIYPDRHQGSSCFLINIGSVVISYGIEGRRVMFSSEPQIFVGDEESYVHGSLVDFVNCKREEREFADGLAIMSGLKASCIPGEYLLLLLDGSLIFWHLEAKDPVLRMTFLSCYCASLETLYKSGLACVGYISMAKNKDLVNLLRFAVHSGIFKDTSTNESLDHLLDVHVSNFFLEPYMRTVVFKHQSKFCDLYPSSVRPYFFYLHVGSEIARIEIPAWIALNEDYVNDISSIILDNCIKGRGYPVALAEAHEQAVVKGPDREFFYHLIQKVGFDHHRNVLISQKNVKKRGIGI